MFYDLTWLTEAKTKADGSAAEKQLINIKWKCPACKKSHSVKWPKSICRAVAYQGGASMFCLDKSSRNHLVNVPISNIKMP